MLSAVAGGWCLPICPRSFRSQWIVSQHIEFVDYVGEARWEIPKSGSLSGAAGRDTCCRHEHYRQSLSAKGRYRCLRALDDHGDDGFDQQTAGTFC